MTTRIYKRFTFEAAHRLATMPAAHPYARIHGHSFEVMVVVRGAPAPETGWIMDLGVLDQRLGEIRRLLDHGLLNEVEGLETPTLERIARWIWDRLAPEVPGLARVEVARPSLGEGAIYEGRGELA